MSWRTAASALIPKKRPSILWNCEIYAGATVAFFQDLKGELIPAALSCRAEWILNKLLMSRKHLTKSEILDVVLPELTNLINSLSKGNEKEHLHSLLRLADFRGSDIRLLTEALVDRSRQHIPYPAFIWRWECVQSYPWAEKQHIYILEFTAFSIYFRTCFSSPVSFQACFSHFWQQSM